MPNSSKSTLCENIFDTNVVRKDVIRALVEDLCPNNSGNITVDELNTILKNDVTASLIDESSQAHAVIVARESFVMCGAQWADLAFSLLDPNVSLTWHYKDGDIVNANKILVDIKGNARAMLSAERSALNFLQFLSATASTTAKYTKYLQGSTTQLLDTRKTIPGFRLAQKYAVRCGGGHNHRLGLYDAFLIKENHIKACGGIERAVIKAKSLHPNKKVEVEVENLQELKQAITSKADIIMLDNFSTQQIQEAVSITNQQCKLEVSGNITEERLAELANLGVDYVSSGAISKHVKAIDLSLLIL